MSNINRIYHNLQKNKVLVQESNNNKLLFQNISLWGSGSGRYREYLYERF